ncbi:hypothetical protein GCM10022419_013080 [Nonomuraea rosea]|uniref:DUF222 domain-containing protein n=1 Tax=Nonomuraea rosea TaxID=638574 RepID=A0ABP6VFL3_9ACTN
MTIAYRPDARPCLPPEVAHAEPGALVCRRHGQQWQLSLGARTTLMDDSVGMRFLALLIANPGQVIRAVDLVAGPALPDEPARDGGAPPHRPGADGQLTADGQPMAGGGSVVSDVPVLDEQAIGTYREHLSLLQAEIADLQSSGATERAAACRAERDWLVAELAAATRQGRRAQRFADGEERATIAVRKIIRRTLTRIVAVAPVIGDELRATVHIGERCAYHPR